MESKIQKINNHQIKKTKKIFNKTNKWKNKLKKL